MRDNYQYIDKRIDHGTTITFKKSKYTTLITFEFAPVKGSNQINVLDKHRQIFVEMKKIDANTKMIRSKKEKCSNIPKKSHQELNLQRTSQRKPIHKYSPTSTSAVTLNHL